MNIYVGTKGKVSIASKDAFNYYKSQAKLRNPETTYRLNQYVKIVNAFHSKVADKLVESVGGVFLDNFGYFCMAVHPKKEVIKVPYKKDGDYFNFKTDNKLVTPMFFGIARKKPLLRFWVMDRTFSRRNVKARLHKKLISGMKYKNFVSTLSSLYLIKKY